MAEHRQSDGGTLSERYDDLLEQTAETYAKTSALIRMNEIALDALVKVATGRGDPEQIALDALRDVRAVSGERL